MELNEGDFLYQADQELFLVVVEENEESYKLAAHGWREVGKDRLSEYIENEHMSLYTSKEVVEEIEQSDEESLHQRIKDLKRILFDTYADRTFDEDGPQSSFILRDTDDDDTE